MMTSAMGVMTAISPAPNKTSARSTCPYGAQATQGGPRRRQQEAGTPTLRLHHQARAERPECRAEPGQPEKETDDSRLFCLAERTGDQRERHRGDGSAGQSVKGARNQEHSTRLRGRCE
jgi:hypothetical protein